MEINSNTPKSTTSTSSGLGNSQRPGEYLRQIRLSQKKELSEVAQELKIPEKQLAALEKDDYKALPEAPFIKGYYRAYAKFLNTDATVLIQRFDEIYSNDTGLPPNHALKDSPIKIMGRLSSSGRRGINKWVKRLFVLIVLLVLLWAIWAGLSNWNSKKSVTEVDSVGSNNRVVEVLPMSSGAATHAGSEDQLVLEFSQPTSVMITDVTGKTLAQGRQATTLNLNGQAPFSIRLDDASAVKLKLNNETIGLSSYTKSNGSADFRLSP
ncbi:helix-turn-helix domain-containing protein [Acinetobacter populi]|uniref:Helix-turn-helix domain-containing protein n=1 Tax=Acinetobacter populi TaxID=1582270 RepID=A0A1Z9Z2S3_9GAMM|nr:helix-turn-helix domain-containing protein [Acinetobacter populi]OUY08760.1 helix-turn-helix domain-containing protein [Acinetobacter populi]